jgi:hypothetical protein
MPRQHRTRYDIFKVPSGPELKAIYLKEGLSDEEATQKAQKLHDEINKAVVTETRFWKKVRDHEDTVGLDVDIFLEGEGKYAS